MHQHRHRRGFAEPAVDDGQACGVGEHRHGAAARRRRRCTRRRATTSRAARRTGRPAGVLAAQCDAGDQDLGERAAVGRHRADPGSQRRQGSAPGWCGAAGHRSSAVTCDHPSIGCHPTEQRRSGWLRGLQDQRRARIGRQRHVLAAAAARRRCCGTAAPPRCRACRRPSRCGCVHHDADDVARIVDGRHARRR